MSATEYDFEEEESVEITATAARQVAFAQLLAEEMELEKEVIFFPSADDAKWFSEEENNAIVITPETFDGEHLSRRECWMYEVFQHLVVENNEHISQLKGDLDENKDTFYELMAKIGRNSIDSVLTERGHDPDELREN